MPVLKPFKGFRPPVEIVKDMASRPYDVLNSDEAREEAKGNPYSLLHIVKPEIDCPVGISQYDQRVYDTAKRNFEQFRKDGWLVQDKQECLYIYAQTMNGRSQYGIVGCAAVKDYMDGKIKEHELTRKDKEADRVKHVKVTNANMEPVFFTYRAEAELDKIISEFTSDNDPVYDFTLDDGIGHHFWVIDDQDIVGKIVDIFDTIPCTYVADGHHRTAAAVIVGNEKKSENPNHTGKEEYNFFLAVHFPDNQLDIIDYNRVVKDLNGLDAEGFIEKLKSDFEIEPKGSEVYRPEGPHNFSLYLEGEWYSFTAKPGRYNDADPIGCLDVTVLSELVLDKILGIKDLRTDDRIDFVGGIRGLNELKRVVDSGKMKAAFALAPATMKQLMDIADTGNMMPPKTTWFEPKLRSGLVVHLLE